MNSQFLKIGHRGASGYKPENTLASFEKAIELGVDMIELDVHLCQTGELVVIHDELLNRTTDGYGAVAEKSYEEISGLDAGNGERIPLLEEVIDLVSKRAKINIELKGKDTCSPVLRVIDNYVIKGHWAREDFLISSFDHEQLISARKINPEVRLGVFFTDKYKFPFNMADELCAYSIHPSMQIVTKEIIREAHQRGFKVFVWTVNEREDVDRIKSLGVDGMFSNFPDLL